MYNRSMVTTGVEFIKWLEAAGVLREGEEIYRVVLDARVDQPLMMYVQRYGTTDITDRKLIPDCLLEAELRDL